MNKYICTGYLSQDSDLRYTKNNTAVSNFTVAVNSSYGDHKRTDFIKCVLFGKRAEGLSQYLVKGTLVEVDGELHIDKGQDGKYYTSIAVLGIQMLGGKKSQFGNRSSHKTFNQMATENDDPFGTPEDMGDLPF